MSEENVAVVRRGLERFMKTGEVLEETFDVESLEVHDHDILDGRDYRGAEGFMQWLEDWSAAWEEWSLDPEEYIDAGERVIVVAKMHARGRGSGVEVDRQDALLYELRDGLIVRIDYFNNRSEALTAAGLA
jgi:ketosteroid isomerase-like protein